MKGSRGLEERLKAWAYAGALTVVASVLLCLGLLTAVWRREVRQVRQEMDAYTRAEALALGRNLLYDLASDPRVLRVHYLEQTLTNLGRELKANATPSPVPEALLSLVRANLELPDTQIWVQARELGLSADLRTITTAKRMACEEVLADTVEDLQEDLQARITFSDHLRGVRLVSTGGLVNLEAGEDVPITVPRGETGATVELSKGRLLIQLPLYVETRHWGRAYLLMDREVLSRVTLQLMETLDLGTVFLSALLVCLLAVWALWTAWLLRSLRRDVVAPVVSLAGRKESWARREPARQTDVGEPERLNDAFDRLLQRVAEQQDQLLRAQKMGLMERLGAGLSHELNNALNPALLRLEEIALAGRAPDASDLRALHDYLASAQAILKDVSAAARKSSAPSKLLAPREWLGVAKRLVEPHFTSGPRLVWDVLEDVPLLKGEEQGLVQVAVNLLLNAKEAVEQKGTEGEVKVSLNSRDGCVLLRVEDDGPGLPPSILDHLFEPFVTTKAQGTGLGLFVVDTLVRRMGGRVSLSPGQGGGIVAEVIFPEPEKEDDERA
jgi:C4-dicarboxylate-specific signal transduction histidine kinase